MKTFNRGLIYNIEAQSIASFDDGECGSQQAGMIGGVPICLHPKFQSAGREKQKLDLECDFYNIAPTSDTHTQIRSNS